MCIFITGSRECAEKNHVEDGEFSTILLLTDEQEDHLRNQGVILEQKFSMDINQDDGAVLRLMKNRSEINWIAVDEGGIAQKNGEVLLEKRYCKEHNYAVGDRIRIQGKEFEIVGIGTTPDYDLPLRNFSDMSAESFFFGTAFVTAGQYGEILADGAQGTENYSYAYRLQNCMTHDDIKEEVKNLLTAFATAEDNPRILAAAIRAISVSGRCCGSCVQASAWS